MQPCNYYTGLLNDWKYSLIYLEKYKDSYQQVLVESV